MYFGNFDGSKTTWQETRGSVYPGKTMRHKLKGVDLFDQIEDYMEKTPYRRLSEKIEKLEDIKKLKQFDNLLEKIVAEISLMPTNKYSPILNTVKILLQQFRFQRFGA